METINIAPADWLTTEQTAKLLGKKPRTVQEMAKDGRLKWKPAGAPHPPNARLYDAQDVLRVIEKASGLQRIPSKPHPTRAPEAVALRKETASRELVQGARALDMVSIVGQIMAAHKGELQLFADQLERNSAKDAKNMETIVALILNHQKQQADADREERKANREDARERWELERKDKLERQRARVTAQHEKPKAKRAHA